MDLREMMEKLNEVDQGGPRYDVSDEVSAARSGGDAEDFSLLSDGSVSMGHVSGDDSIGTEDEDDEGWGKPEAGKNNEADAAVEDMDARAEELKEELQACTLRCDELRKTLIQTRSFIKERKVQPDSPMGGKNHAKVAPGDAMEISSRHLESHESFHSPAVQQGALLEEDEDDSDSYSDDDDYDCDSYNSDFAEEDDHVINRALIREAKGLAPLADITEVSEADSDTQELSARRGTPRLEYPQKPNNNHVPELSDVASPTGRLADRIRSLRQNCMKGLGEVRFRRAYEYLKAMMQYDAEEDRVNDGVAQMDANEDEEALLEIFGEKNMEYQNLIEQLIFMEESHSG